MSLQKKEKMNKVIAFFLCLTALISCDDGDLEIPAFDFEEEVHYCDTENNEYTLFRMGIAEAIIVTLPTSAIQNKVTIEPKTVSITESNVVYRTFNEEISTAYFCGNVPPTAPQILSNWIGISGGSNNILIETIEELDASNNITGYRHFISFQNLKVEKGGKHIAFEETEFGEIVTTI